MKKRFYLLSPDGQEVVAFLLGEKEVGFLFFRYMKKSREPFHSDTLRNRLKSFHPSIYHPVIFLASAVILESCFRLASALKVNPLNPKIKL